MPQDNFYINVTLNTDELLEEAIRNNPIYNYTEEDIERVMTRMTEWNLETYIKDNAVKSKKKEIKQYPIVKFLEGLK